MGAKNVYPSPKFLRFTSFADDIDLAAEAGKPYGHCREIRADDEGVVAVESEAGDIVPLPFAAGEKQVVVCRKILASGTTVSGVTVYW